MFQIFNCRDSHRMSETWYKVFKIQKIDFRKLIANSLFVKTYVKRIQLVISFVFLRREKYSNLFLYNAISHVYAYIYNMYTIYN